MSKSVRPTLFNEIAVEEIEDFCMRSGGGDRGGGFGGGKLIEGTVKGEEDFDAKEGGGVRGGGNGGGANQVETNSDAETVVDLEAMDDSDDEDDIEFPEEVNAKECEKVRLEEEGEVIKKLIDPKLP